MEVAVRWRTYAYVKNSYCRFLKSHLNKLDVFVVAVDIVLAIVINVLMSRLNSLSGDAATSEQYAPLVSGLRILRLFRLFRVVRAVRVLRRLAQEVQGTAEGYESHVELEDFEDPETIIERVRSILHLNLRVFPCFSLFLEMHAGDDDRRLFRRLHGTLSSVISISPHFLPTPPLFRCSIISADGRQCCGTNARADIERLVGASAAIGAKLVVSLQ